ncbi:uncharacterized protein LOC114478620 [Gouania willdenowi]|uniref:uncharacterized protein LOC114478620 n=1 Tax=Gouania willdenowi TaxID=441366 RepID=UPI0010556EF4|nr:uncharacterized protein LOC114478620 [Gouania willdenowi]
MTHWRVFTLFLLLFGTVASNTDIYSETNYGKNFLVFWPENIAHYYPMVPDNKIQVIALHNETKVTIKSFNDEQSKEQMKAGESYSFKISGEMEVKRKDISNKTYQITSNLDIVVQVISVKEHSMQIVLVIPNDKFGSKFFIPPVVSRITDVINEVTERNPFRLLCVSDQKTTVTVKGSTTRKVTLQSNQVAQIWLDSSDSVVESDKPIGIYLSHPCLVQKECNCSLLYTMLPPVKDQNLNFFIPPVLVKNAAETFILKADGVQTQPEPFDDTSPQVESKGTAFLQLPGLLLPLIAEQDGAACYVVNSIQGLMNTAVIVVHKDKKTGVHIGSSPIKASDWQDLKGTDYVSAEVEIIIEKNVIWHADATMAVYLMSDLNGFHMGTPAPIISKIPDFRGCVIEPEIIHVGDVANGWRESLQYCREQNMDLICFSSEKHRLKVNRFISENHSGLKDLWIGMRRSSLTGAWYWVSDCPLVDTSWAEGEPGQVQDGHCVMMEKDQEFTWRDEACCKAAQPVCNSPVLLFPI